MNDAHTKMLHKKDEILEAALQDIPFTGWNWSEIEKSLKNQGFENALVNTLFASKTDALLDHFADWADRRMLNALKDIDPETLRIRDRVKTALLLRFEALEPHKDAAISAAQYWALPFKKPKAAKLVWRTADQIWVWAGDTSTDYNRYSKRALLSGVMVASTLYWLNDKNADPQAFEAFIDRRIDTVLKLGQKLNNLKNIKSKMHKNRKTA